MPRRKKRKEIKIEPVQCPIKGHRHKIELVPYPERPDMLIGYCDGREVYMCKNPNIHAAVDEQPPAPTVTTYRVPSYQEKENEGE